MTIQWGMMIMMMIVYGGHPQNSISDANTIRYTSALVPNIRVIHVLLLRVGVVYNDTMVMMMMMMCSVHRLVL
jgi:hypothetical protein